MSSAMKSAIAVALLLAVALVHVVNGQYAVTYGAYPYVGGYQYPAYGYNNGLYYGGAGYGYGTGAYCATCSVVYPTSYYATYPAAYAATPYVYPTTYYTQAAGPYFYRFPRTQAAAAAASKK